MKLYYESGFKVEQGDIVLSNRGDFILDIYEVIYIDDKGNIKYEYARQHSSSNTIPSQPDEHIFLISRKNDSKNYLGLCAPKKNYDADSNTYFYQNGIKVEQGDIVLIDNCIECRVSDIDSPDYKYWFGGGIYLIPTQKSKEYCNYSYFFYPYITEDILFLRRRN